MHHNYSLIYVACNESAIFHLLTLSKRLQIDKRMIISYKHIGDLHNKQVVLLCESFRHFFNTLEKRPYAISGLCIKYLNR